MSLSGHERNKLFMSDQGVTFRDRSGISGVDSPKDGRSSVIWDFDRDGWQDIAIANVNAPILHLFRNNFSASISGGGNMLAVRCVGGNQQPAASSQWSSRDGYGARIFVKIGDSTLMRELRCGEGLAAQNSKTLVFGLGDVSKADSVAVHWPSGKVQTIENVAENSLVTVFENAADNNGSEHTIDSYRRNADTQRLVATPEPLQKSPLHLESPPSAKLVMYTSMATWCPSCRDHLPELARIREFFDDEQLAMLGVPIDVKDTSEMLSQYTEQMKPAYQILANLDTEMREKYESFIQATINREALPSTMITDNSGNVIQVWQGVPTISQLTRIMKAENGSEMAED